MANSNLNEINAVKSGKRRFVQCRMSMAKWMLRGSVALAIILGIASCAARGKALERSGAIAEHARPGGNRYVVVLSLDGFRYDYQSKAHTPHLDAMDREGLSGSFLPCFPSLTFPNHYSMATGLHPNSHGLVANEFWDERGMRYRLGDRRMVEDPEFYHGEPLWNTARRQGVRTASFFWVGSETKINGHQPDRWKRFDSKVPYYERADSVLSWLQLPEDERPHLVMWYLEEPDHTGHHHTPEGEETRQMIQQVDSVVGYFRQGLANLPVADQVDFILVSDHGMMTFERVINLADYLSAEDVEHVAAGPFTHIYPRAGRAEDVLRKLKGIKGMRVMRKGELPQRLQYGTNARIGEVVALADPGVTILFRAEGLPKNILAAGHGFDNAYPEMLAVFKAVGPHFAAGKRIKKPIPNITLYPLVCQLLGITPASHDADGEKARALLK